MCCMSLYMYMCVSTVFKLYIMCVPLYSAKGINDTALDKKIKFVCLFVNDAKHTQGRIYILMYYWPWHVQSKLQQPCIDRWKSSKQNNVLSV